MTIIGIDPGHIQSAFAEWNGTTIMHAGIIPNEEMIPFIDAISPRQVLLIEQLRGFGLTVGNEVMDTIWWSGRFFQVAGRHLIVSMVPRKTIVSHLCGTGRAGDKEVGEALRYRIGEKGTKKKPGPTFGMAGDMWAALSVSVYGWDMVRVGGIEALFAATVNACQIK